MIGLGLGINRAALPTLLYPFKWGYLGDSITNGSNASNSIYAFPAQSTFMAGTGVNSAARVVSGHPGARSDQIATYLSDIISSGCRGLVLLAGTNDAGQSVDPSVYISNMTGIVSSAKAAGLLVVVCTVPPRGVSSVTPTTRSLTASYNDWIVNTLPTLYDVHIADTFTALVDTVDMLPAYDSGDGVHPNNAGHDSMGHAVATAIRQVTGGRPPMLSLATGRYRANNLIANGLMTGAGAKPTGWFEQPGGTGTAPTYQIISDSTGFLSAGSFAEMDFNAVSGGARTFACAVGSGWSVGDTLAVTAKMQVSDVAGNWHDSALGGASAGLSARLTNQSGVGMNAILGVQNTAGLPSGAGLFNIGAIATRIVVPTGTTSIALWFTATLPTGGNAKIRIGEVGVFNLTKLGIASGFN